MQCLRCGYCCINYNVVIINNPEKGISRDNLIYKPGGERCRHLIGNKPGEFNCSIHDKPYYNETPCFDFTQIEKENSLCRMGKYVMNKQKQEGEGQ